MVLGFDPNFVGPYKNGVIVMVVGGLIFVSYTFVLQLCTVLSFL